MKGYSTINAECSSCAGTGLYSGIAEPKGTAVICLDCNGSGCMKLKYRPFSGRVLRKDIKTVSMSRGKFLLSCGSYGKSITYQDFLDGKLPAVTDSRD